jgi:hypothetical protein
MRSVTRSEVKWLLVERATIAGDIAQLKESQQLIQDKLEECESRLAALDATIAFVNHTLSVEAAGTIQRHTPEYRKRGALKALIIKVLQEAAPKAIDTLTIAHAVAAHFNLVFSNNYERIAFARNSIGKQLRRLRQEGVAESCHQGTNVLGMWRWKNQLPSWGKLQQAASSGVDNQHGVD